MGQEIDALAGARSPSLRFVGHVCAEDPGRDDEAAFRARFCHFPNSPIRPRRRGLKPKVPHHGRS
jgi:hypothetical protein